MRQLKREHRDSDADLADALWARTCLLCRTFGAPWWASVVRVVDAEVVPELWTGQFEVRDGVAIDRDKGAAAHQRLYSYEVVPAGTPFAMHLTVRNPSDWQLGLLWLGVRALVEGQIALGGMRYRGLGWVRLEDFTFTLVEPETVLTWLAGGAEGLTLTDPDDPRAKPWMQELQAELGTAGAEMEEAAYA
jgi:CRISPR-associated RAMP protein (TIGR02581 family)